MKKAGFILIFAVLFSILNSLFCSAAPGSLENFGMSYIGSGYAAPVDFFNNNFPIFYLNSENFILDSSNQIVNIGVDASLNQGYIYKQGWIWNPRLGDWIPFQFDNPGVSGSYWINGSESISKTLSINATNNLENGLNFIAVFSCKKYNNQWKCGCDSANDVSCNKWSLLAFNVSNANWTAEKSSLCVTDSDCNILAGEKCISNTCTFVPQCNNDSQCGDGKKCLNQICAECLDNSHCTSPKKCFNQKCLECINDSDCTSTQYCNVAEKKCFNKCTSSTYCLPNQYCYLSQQKCLNGPRKTVSNLVAYNSTENSISWSWNNPSPAEFNGLNITVSGVNTNLDFFSVILPKEAKNYTAQGLSMAGYPYYILVHTFNSDGENLNDIVNFTSTAMTKTQACASYGGYYYNRLCWYMGDPATKSGAVGQSCSQVCAFRGGTNSLTCNDDSGGTALCQAWKSPNMISTTLTFNGPHYGTYRLGAYACGYTNPLTSCSATPTINSNIAASHRLCACKRGSI